MAGQAGSPVNHPISPHVISGAFVQQYYHILHEQPDQVHKFYQDSSILGRPESNGTMVSVSTLGDINEKIMSMDFRDCLTAIETADAQLSHGDGVLIVVTGSLTYSEGVCRRFTQSFFLAPQESGGYFVLNDVFRFISERQPAEINQVGTQENESSQNVISASETCASIPKPTAAEKSLISDHVAVEDYATEGQVVNPSVNGTTVEKNVTAEPPVQVAKEDPKRAPVAAPPPAPSQTDVTKKSYASIVKVMKEGPPAPLVARTTPSIAKHKQAPKPVTKAVEGPVKSSAKPTQDNEGPVKSSAKLTQDSETNASDGIVAENSSLRNEQGYSVFVKSLPFNANIEIVEDEFKKFGAIKPGGVQVRHNKVDRFCFGFVEYESRQSMQEAIEASPVHMGEKEVFVEKKRAPTRVVSGDNGGGGRFQSGRGVYRGDNFGGQGGGYMNNANYRGGDTFIRRNDSGDNYNWRNDGGDNYNRRNDGGDYYNRRNDGGDNYNRRNEGGDNYNRRNDGGDNYNRRTDGGGNYNRSRNDGGENYNGSRNEGGGENYNRSRNEGGGENYNRSRNEGGGENYNRSRNEGGGENYNRSRNEGGGENYNRSRNEGGGENYNRSRNDGGGDNYNHNRRNNFRNQNEFSGGHGQGPPPGNGYPHSGNGFHPPRSLQNGNGRPARVNGPKQPPAAA